MELLRRLVDSAPDDPVLLAGAVVAAWLPICVVGVLCLVALAAVQNYLHRRPRAPRLLVMPPAEVRPLVMRRTITAHRQTNVLLDLTRLTLAIGAVLAFTVLVLAAGGATLLHALGR